MSFYIEHTKYEELVEVEIERIKLQRLESAPYRFTWEIILYDRWTNNNIWKRAHFFGHSENDLKLEWFFFPHYFPNHSAYLSAIQVLVLERFEGLWKMPQKQNTNRLKSMMCISNHSVSYLVWWSLGNWNTHTQHIVHDKFRLSNKNQPSFIYWK